MREIKFRGKDIKTGKWVYGDLIANSAASKPLIKPMFVDCNTSTEPKFVDPSTVGQSMGLLDINEKDIYEGDIVEWNFTYRYICANGGVEFRETIVKGIIKWQQGGFILDVIENDFEDAGWYGISELNTDTGSDVEIIGNIHDNPELIKQNKEE